MDALPQELDWMNPPDEALGKDVVEENEVSEARLDFNMENVNKRIELEQRRIALETALKQVKKEIEALHGPILQDMTKTGLKNIPLQNGMCVYARRELYCSKKKGVETKEVIEALRVAGLDFLVEANYSPKKLKEWLKEQEKEQGPEVQSALQLLPDAVQPLFNVEEVTKTIVLGAKS